MKTKEKQRLDLTAYRLVVTLAKTQLMEQWEQSEDGVVYGVNRR